MKDAKYQPRGFAMITAIIMLAVVSAALVVISRQFAFDARRTRIELQDAQLRQLLMAGAQDVVQQAQTWPATPPATEWQTQIPSAIAGEGGAVFIRSVPSADGIAEIHIKARFEGQRQTQAIHFKRQDGAWKIVDATFGA